MSPKTGGMAPNGNERTGQRIETDLHGRLPETSPPNVRPVETHIAHLAHQDPKDTSLSGHSFARRGLWQLREAGQGEHGFERPPILMALEFVAFSETGRIQGTSGRKVYKLLCLRDTHLEIPMLLRTRNTSTEGKISHGVSPNNPNQPFGHSNSHPAPLNPSNPCPRVYANVPLQVQSDPAKPGLLLL